MFLPFQSTEDPRRSIDEFICCNESNLLLCARNYGAVDIFDCRETDGILYARMSKFSKLKA